MLSFVLPFYGLKNIINHKGNIFINIISCVVSLFLYTAYYILILFVVTFLINKDNFGIIPICNKMSERTLIINGFVFPICYRCMTISLTLFIFIPTFIFCVNKFNKLIIIISIILVIIGFLDGLLQYVFNIDSTNLRRVITGMLAGLGFSYLFSFIFNKLIP